MFSHSIVMASESLFKLVTVFPISSEPNENPGSHDQWFIVPCPSAGIRPSTPFPDTIYRSSWELCRRSPSINSLPLMAEHLPKFLRDVRDTPQTLKQQQFFEVPQRQIRSTSSKERRPLTMGTELNCGRGSLKVLQDPHRLAPSQTSTSVLQGRFDQQRCNTSHLS
ncbi:hypothetical protein AVEN_196329-1 [Araneus ventricosus]|uniref:Uncharacterized protein n=1 Tax=Araneus ventricosus TaxID=182803 RepID=A0A4Y2AUG7_ARAVE|nr:hypothetical protein AVEN_196329-1 [Araneus ventricosus]